MGTDLLTLAEAQIAEKQYEEIKAIKERLEQDKEVIVKAIQMVNEHTLYKKVSSNGYSYSYKYVLATEEMLKEDYLKKPDGWCQKGIKFNSKNDYNKYSGVILTVNGEAYYDIRYALETYKETVEEKERKVNRLNESIRNLQEDIANLYKEFPSLKKAIEEWQEYQKNVEGSKKEND
jgi:uncharacterized coiled-coil DUF342 family protein